VLYLPKFNTLDTPVNKVKLKVKFALEQTTKAQRRS
jgi:hypothetical protein